MRMGGSFNFLFVLWRQQLHVFIYFVFYSLVCLLLEGQFYFVPSCFLSLLVDFVVHSKYFYVYISFLLTKSDGLYELESVR